MCCCNNTSITIVRVENRKDKKMEHEMDSEVYIGLDRLSITLVVRVVELGQHLGGCIRVILVKRSCQKFAQE